MLGGPNARDLVRKRVVLGRVVKDVFELELICDEQDGEGDEDKNKPETREVERAAPDELEFIGCKEGKEERDRASNEGCVDADSAKLPKKKSPLGCLGQIENLVILHLLLLFFFVLTRTLYEHLLGNKDVTFELANACHTLGFRDINNLTNVFDVDFLPILVLPIEL